MSHITIKTKDTDAEVVWPVARVHLSTQKCPGIPEEGYWLISPERYMYALEKEEYERVKELLTNPLIRFTPDHPPCEMHCSDIQLPGPYTSSSDPNKVHMPGCGPLGNPDEPETKIQKGDLVSYLGSADMEIPFGTRGRVLDVVSKNEDGALCYEIEFEIDPSYDMLPNRYVTRRVYECWLQFNERPAWPKVPSNKNKAPMPGGGSLVNPDESFVDYGEAETAVMGTEPKLHDTVAFNKDAFTEGLQATLEIFREKNVTGVVTERNRQGYKVEYFVEQRATSGWFNREQLIVLKPTAAFPEHVLVRFLKDVQGYPITGERGTVVHVHNGGEAYEVEFLDEGNEERVITVEPDEIKLDDMQPPHIKKEIPDHMKKIMKDAEVKHDVKNRKPGRNDLKLTKTEIDKLVGQEIVELERGGFVSRPYGDIYLSNGVYYLKPSRKEN